MDLIDKFYEDYLAGQKNDSRPIIKDRDLLCFNYLKNCKKIFELGVGVGTSLYEINADFKGGVDVSQKSIDLTREQLLKKNTADQIELFKINIDKEDLPVENNKYDGVMIIETLEHLFDPIHALSESNRILKNNGLLFVTVPNIGYFETRFLMLKSGELNDFSGSGKILTEHIRFFGKKSLSDIIKLSGFKVVSVKGSMKKIINKNEDKDINQDNKNHINKKHFFRYKFNLSNIFKLLNKIFRLYNLFPSFFSVGLVIEAVKISEPRFRYNEAISELTKRDDYNYQINQTKKN